MSLISLLYRGSLASCNYHCPYCPFAKIRDSRASLARDAGQLARFTDWIASQEDPGQSFNLLFTPWGEALTRRHYRQAIIRLSRLPQVARVAIQTNLSIRPLWLADAQTEKVALWCTYHPGETPRAAFLQRLAQLAEMRVRHSVGSVGLRAHWPEIGALRQALPPETYLWINAYQDPDGKTDPAYYSAAEADWLSAIDPWFPGNRQPPASLGAPCRAGESALSVDGEGGLRACHFRPEPRGNLYQENWRQTLSRGTCPQPRCDCYIGYILRHDLPQGAEFGLGDLARTPPDFHWQRPTGWPAEGPATQLSAYV
ncbi:MAG: STM4011 family radical SAM protein [Azonexus sp.]